MIKNLVNPISVAHCHIQLGEQSFALADLSFIRVVLQGIEGAEALIENESVRAQFVLDKFRFEAEIKFQARGEGWLRFKLGALVPSYRAQLASFLSPKRVGESLVEDNWDDGIAHFHGLNESSLWVDRSGRVIFTYLDQWDGAAQFVVRMGAEPNEIVMGKVSRESYFGMSSMDAIFDLLPLSERELAGKLAECRDIITNFRPAGAANYALKQRLLKTVSESLYSSGNSPGSVRAPIR